MTHLCLLSALGLLLWLAAAWAYPLLAAPRPQGHSTERTADLVEDWRWESQVLIVGSR